MKSVLILCAIVTAVNCSPQGFFGSRGGLGRITQTPISFSIPDYKSAKTLVNRLFVSSRGFSYDVDTSDDFHHHVQGEQKSETGREEDEGPEVQGYYSYKGDDGKNYVVEYTAGKDGFRPYGTHIPPAAGIRKEGLGLSPGAAATLAGTGLG